MTLLVGALLAALALGVVLWPFLRRGGTTAAPNTAKLLAQVQRRREAIYDAISSLQVEYRLGQVNAADYQERFQAYRLQAAAALREQEELEELLVALDQALEEEIRAARRSSDGARESAKESEEQPL